MYLSLYADLADSFFRRKPQVNHTQVEEIGIVLADKEFDDRHLSFFSKDTVCQQTLFIDTIVVTKSKWRRFCRLPTALM